MKKTFSILAFSICSLFILSSCVKTIESSQFNEFQIQCKDGTVRSGGIYIPGGIKSDDRLPVIYMADGLVFKDCYFKFRIN